MAKTTVTITEVDGKWKVQGTTYVDNDPNRPWPVDFECKTEQEALDWAAKHGWIVE